MIRCSHNVTNVKFVDIYRFLQVLTAEDEESPILSFSSGTILGEITCLLPTNSIANVRCATYCELHTLSTDALYRVLKNYPQKTKSLLSRLHKRIENAREIENYLHSQPIKIFLNCVQTAGQDLSIKWIKYQWRRLAKLHRTTKKTEASEMKIEAGFSSEYLDLLVLSEEVELKMQVICLRGSCPFILEPNSSFRHFTHYLVLFAAVVQSILLPYDIAFNRKISSTLFTFLFVMDVIYFMDIYLKLSTALKIHNILTSHSSKIIIERLKEVNFLVDIIATIPADYSSLLFKMPTHLEALLRINRLLKIYELIRFVTTQESSIKMNSLSARLFKYLFIYGLISYWTACLMYAISCFTEKCSYYGWFNYNLILETVQEKQSERNQSDFLISLFYTLSTFMGVGISNIMQYIPLDIVAHNFIVMLGQYLTYSFVSPKTD